MACDVRANPAPNDVDVRVNDGANRTLVAVKKTANLTEGFKILFFVNPSVKDDAVVFRVDGGDEVPLSSVIEKTKGSGSSGATVTPAAILSMQEISVIVGVAGMVVILVGIGIFVVFTRKPTSHDFSMYPNR